MTDTLQNGKYRILGRIGAGGFGVTYKALRTADNRVVCIKEFFIDMLCSRDAATGRITTFNAEADADFQRYKRSFLKEGQTLRGIRHPSIVGVSDVFEERGTAYYVMDYVDGMPLSDIIPSNGFDASVALPIISRLLDAVEYLHSRKITHFDIKPSNILMRSQDDIVLIDFGGSKRYREDDSQTSTSPIATSEGFAPLELYQHEGVGEFSPATDIYELGATLYNMVTGQVPPSASEILDEGNPIESKNVSPVVKRAIRLAMEPGKKRRLQSVDALRRVLNGEPADDTVISSDDTVITSDDTLIDTDDTVIDGGEGNVNKQGGNAVGERRKGIPKWVWILLGAVVLLIVALVVWRVGATKSDVDYEDVEPVAVVDEVSDFDRAMEQYATVAANVNSQCPQQVAEGMTMTGCYFKYPYISYWYDCTPETYDGIFTNLQAWEKDMAAQLRSDAAAQAMLQECAKDSVMIRYRFANTATGISRFAIYNTITKSFE